MSLRLRVVLLGLLVGWYACSDSDSGIEPDTESLDEHRPIEPVEEEVESDSVVSEPDPEPEKEWAWTCVAEASGKDALFGADISGHFEVFADTEEEAREDVEELVCFTMKDCGTIHNIFCKDLTESQESGS